MKMHRNFDVKTIIRRTVATLTVGAALFSVSACGAKSADKTEKRQIPTKTTAKIH